MGQEDEQTTSSGCDWMVSRVQGLKGGGGMAGSAVYKALKREVRERSEPSPSHYSRRWDSALNRLQAVTAGGGITL